jgi:hypothetical protein
MCSTDFYLPEFRPSILWRPCTLASRYREWKRIKEGGRKDERQGEEKGVEQEGKEKRKS